MNTVLYIYDNDITAICTTHYMKKYELMYKNILDIW